MDIKDDVVRLYIKRFVIPKALIFDKPAFVDFKISGKTNVFARQILVPETFFIQLEKKIVQKYKDAGKSAMYSVGKKFGYSFSQLGRFENIKDHPGDGVKDWIIIASKFVEGTYASEIRQTADVSKNVVDYVLKNFVICRSLGYDFFLATGGAAGVIAWLLQNKDIEGYYYDSQFKGDEHTCKVKCAPFKTLKAISKKDVFSETDLDDLKQDVASYNKFNEEVEISYTKSFSNYLDAKVFTYENGIIKLKSNGERFFLMEVSGLYLLELELKKRKMDREIFDVAYSVGKELFGGLEKDIQPILELLVALGWGEIMLVSGGKSKLQLVINHFPWTNWYKDIDFSVASGLLSGIFSATYGRKINLGIPKVDMNNGYLALLFKEA
jgi:hypothetical protein